MSNYTKATNFATKDSLPSGNPAKIVKGTEINDEYDAIEVAVNSKADIHSPTFTGDPKAPTPSAADNDTSLATTAFTKTVISTGGYVKNGGLDDDIVDARALNVSGDGVNGQFLVSDADGSFSWTAISVLSPATSDPTARDDATSLVEGDQYYNTTDDVIKTYDGTSWNKVGVSMLPLFGEITLISSNASTTSMSHTVTQEGWHYMFIQGSGTKNISWTGDARKYESSWVPSYIGSAGYPTNWDDASDGWGNSESDRGSGGSLAQLTTTIYAFVGETITLTSDTSSKMSIKRWDEA